MLALRAPAPAADLAEKLRLYGQFVGSWEAEGQAFLPDRTTRKHFWEIHFSWVLEGRAIQDVWITPPRHGPRVRESQPWGPFTNQYGTTLRVYEPGLDAWRVTWIDPAAGYRADLIGRPDGQRHLPGGNRLRRRAPALDLQRHRQPQLPLARRGLARPGRKLVQGDRSPRATGVASAAVSVVRAGRGLGSPFRRGAAPSRAARSRPARGCCASR